MPTPATRTPVRIARGTYSNLNSSIADLQEGEVCYATDQNKIYVVESATLVESPSPDLTGDITSVGNATSIASGVIVNADVNASAAIAGTKISPDFGSQTIATTGVFSHALGAAATPSLTFTGDTNTGIYSPGADQVAVATNGTERMTIDSSGRTGFGVPPNTFGDDARITIQGTGVARSIYSNINGNGSSTHITFANGNGVVGSISTNASATAYNTSSDYRLKENIEPVTDGITRLQKLKPSRFNFIADPDTTFDGFIAHEAQAVVPECVTGEKDAVDDDGNPKHQGIDQSKLVPLLTAALQEAIGEIESLKARLTAAGI